MNMKAHKKDIIMQNVRLSCLEACIEELGMLHFIL